MTWRIANAWTLPIVLIFGLLVACSDGVPPSAPTSLLATPPPLTSTATTLIESEEPTPNNTSEPILQETAAPQTTDALPPTAALPTKVAAPATPAPVPDGPLTIVALGDSLTEGDGDVEGEGGGFPARLQRSINEMRPGSRVINLGKSGWTSAQMVEGQLPIALQSNPDIALVWIGSNNLFNNSGPDQEAFDLAAYKDHIDTTLSALTGAGARVFIALMDDHSLRPYTSNPAGAGLSGEGLEYMSYLSTAFNDILREKAAQYGATTVDFYSTTIFTDPSTLSEDGIHPNVRGYDVIAQIWFEVIRESLQ